MDVMTGKVRVVIAWATWCGICRHHVPEQKDAYAKFHDRGVEFIGLTDEAGADMSLVESFVNNAGIPWPNGYGAVETLREYGVADRRPGVWVVGADGIITWNYGMSGTLEKAIEQALKADG
jgi:thiol-disulfide isomerase/thioredoxin